MMMRKVATVFGGAGFIGRQVVQRLAREDWVVRVATRDPMGGRGMHTMGRVGQIAALAADVTDEAGVARAVEGAGVVVNCVGILHGRFEAVQAEGPARIGRLAAAAGVERVVHISAIGADAASQSAYARSKAAGEAGLLAAFPKATILRPSIVFGEGDAFFNRFAQLGTLLPFMPVICGDTKFQPVHVNDVAAAVMAALHDPATEGRTYELGGPRAWSFRELLAFIVQQTQRNRRLVEIPLGLAQVQARFAELLPNPPLTRDQLILLQRDNVVAPGALTLADLGIQPAAVEALVPAYLARFQPGGARRVRPAG
ncbi:complex I NDUFA9 subunit family protein [Sediminicoccus rosea]|uniref:Complex I NDUFA9 subunit family protein n=2 Tax=Sediminicoccus rosea TaxID=1225128 RepID=A0ABZ0PPL4_9PROT|nr:complex I NDUFA9 subunit family protein [Sediminicoccus rosea]WPB87690.1 complex I NDUFA9 subunit family protein [Sediminicoccus rosea]